MNKLVKLAHILACGAYRRALLTRWVAAGIEHDRILPTLKCRTVVDIGANCGQFALAARQRCPDAVIHSFEPLPGPARRFRQVFGRDERVVLNEVAIGPAPGTADMHVSGRQDSSSLLPITPLQDAVFPGTACVGQQTVRVARLTSCVGAQDIVAPALLKIDVQGYELETLKGCEELLERFAFVYVECSFVELYAGQALAAEVIAFLQERGFRLTGTYNTMYDKAGIAVQADLLFASSRNLKRRVKAKVPDEAAAAAQARTPSVAEV